MTIRDHPNADMPHLFSALIACGFAAVILAAGGIVAIHLERSTLRSTASELFLLKNQGLAFQRAAAHARDILPVYGSSELIIPPVPEKASRFFRTAPTGFQVFPVGRLGATSMTILQKVGALGSNLRGKKVAISLSPEWFLSPVTRWDWYKGNFSLLAASKMVFGSTLDFELKRDIASRMLQLPSTFEKSALLEFALRRLASGRRLDHIVFCVLWPLGKIQNAIMDLQDHFAALHYILRQTKPAPPRRSETLNWPILIAQTERTMADENKNEEKALGLDQPWIPPWGERGFLARLNAAPEWVDFELLLRALATIHARPLLLSMPLAGQWYDRGGISRTARETYYKKMRTLVERYHFTLVDFENHDGDPAFLDRQQNHLTGKGWIFYDRVLDDFFHGRAPRA
jgi:D-alanine transfer protein